jgi:trimeric autotransporter adhesin
LAGSPSQPAVQSALGSTVFPAGSKLVYQTSTDLANPEYYDRTNAGRATIPPASDPMSLSMSTWRTATLAEFTAWNTGDLTGAVTEVHGNNSRVLLNRDYVKADGSAAYKRYLVGFDSAALKARFYECEGDMAARAANPPRNATLFVDGKSTCRGILDTTYTITARGYGKVLRFASEPTQLGNMSYRLFVERNNVTYTGGQDKLQVSNQQRLNLQAGEALGTALGLN